MSVPPALPVERARSSHGRAFERRVLTYCGRLHLLPAGERVLVAVSGGPDSLSLLFTLCHLREQLGVELAVGHLDHMLRDESARDASFVAGIAQALSLSFRTEKADVGALARDNRQSIEQAARGARYAFLARAAAELKATTVATGHTQDDLAETFLLRLLRGSGTKGLAAIAPRAPFPLEEGRSSGLNVARPLLGITRDDVLDYCRHEGLPALDDPTNSLPDFTRNRVRHELMPTLRSINPVIRDVLVRTARTSARDEELLHDLAGEAMVEVTIGRSPLRLDRSLLQALPPALGVRVLRRAAAEAGRELSSRQSEEALRLVGTGSGRLDLASGLSIHFTPDAVVYGPPSTAQPKLPPTALAVPGETIVGPWRIEAGLPDGPPFEGGRASGEAIIDLDILPGPLVARSRRPGDRFQPLGMDRDKKLQDFLVDEKVPRAERDTLPIVTVDERIVWVAGLRIAHPFRVTEKTTRALLLRVARP
ncbi:MAG: tRNA lysidine(34) synthetase TilS [Dehalococcoidia bacterium]|nr:tRNA lysidine(34) synthetase TilS [Dehalococcoidia bacterium]